MSKEQILLDQILHIAKGLSTETVSTALDSFTGLLEEKRKQVFKSIDQAEIEELRLLGELLTESEQIEVVVPVNFRIHPYYVEDGLIEYGVYIKNLDGDFEYRADPSEIINPEQLIKQTPTLQESCNRLEERAKKYKKRLGEVAKKHKITIELLTAFIEDEKYE